jgi:two-component system, response regulator
MSEKYILLAEDNSNDVALTIMALKKIGVENRLVVVPDGREALSFLFSAELQENPAVIIMDLKLPFIDGLEVLRQIRSNENTQLLPVIILSASIDANDRIRSLELGANDFQCKPISFNEFVKLMQQICEQWL